MKNKFIILTAGLALIGTVCQAQYNVNTFGVNTPINSTLGNLTIGTTTTNGLYTQTIAPTSTETNLVCLNRGFNSDTISLQFSAGVMASSSSNTVAFVLSSSTGYVPISTTANTNWNQSTSPRMSFGTVTLAFAGTSVTTNIVLGPTTGYCAGTKLYVETIGMGTASTGNFLTNYSVSAMPGE
jgi:hypothetical protein